MHEASTGEYSLTVKRWVRLNRSKGHFSMSERSEKGSNLAVLLLFANFLKIGLIFFIYFIQLLGDDIDQLSRDEFH